MKKKQFFFLCFQRKKQRKKGVIHLWPGVGPPQELHQQQQTAETKDTSRRKKPNKHIL